ncbi:MAG: SpoIIE family protein phosphatase [Bacteroidota bacterium]|nr:SpoIIE family protein phosphatase [Bacteroidota bacterium]
MSSTSDLTSSPQRLPLAAHLPPMGVFDHYRRTIGGVERTHWQVIYLKSQGKRIAEIASVTGYSEPWIVEVIRRYNEYGPDAFVDQPESTVVTLAQHRDLKRQSAELNTASRAQREMLAVSLPDHPELDIAAFQRSASEVGGDYYDFNLTDDGSLTLAIGDATGHGTRAGMMVVATKTLFTTFAGQGSLLDLIRQMSRILKRLNLRATYMHLTLGRYHQGRLDLTGGGMPPALVYRSESGQVEEVAVKGAPPGSFTGFPYSVQSVFLAPGDVALMVSDGLTELMSPSGEMFQSDRVRCLLAELARTRSSDIIEGIRQAGLAWRAECELKDDVTMIVLKRR